MVAFGCAENSEASERDHCSVFGRQRTPAFADAKRRIRPSEEPDTARQAGTLIVGSIHGGFIEEITVDRPNNQYSGVLHSGSQG
ncbi:hypothetical protein [Brevibacterium limosum]|uniref:hypothetical protein n=1 Tax=Brevibacterium limosum TaxID=2697565 RepID=UPI00141F190F|nr:hypothetical protein [Brevibacterium limosum]